MGLVNPFGRRALCFDDLVAVWIALAEDEVLLCLVFERVKERIAEISGDDVSLHGRGTMP